MSAEITGASQLSVTVGASIFSTIASFTADLGSNVFMSEVQSIATTPTLINFGDIDTPAYVFYQNRDSANYVVIGDNNANPTTQKVCKLLAGECILIPGPAAAHYAQANTGAINLFVALVGLNAP